MNQPTPLAPASLKRPLTCLATCLVMSMMTAGCSNYDSTLASDIPVPALDFQPIKCPPYIRPVPAAKKPVAQQPPAAAERTIALGRSVQGREMTLHVFGQGRATLVFGAIHGSEPGSAEAAQGLLEYLRANPDSYAGRCVAVLTAANPDGLAAGTRVNSRGVDINRNFPAKNWKAAKTAQASSGDAPSSEPETVAVIRAVDSVHPERIISIHAALPGNQCNNYDGPAGDIAAAMGRLNGYPVKASIGYPTPGSFGSWAGIDRGIPTITLELPPDLRGKPAWQSNRDAILAAIRGAPASLGK